jgi:hypothetical protein
MRGGHVCESHIDLGKAARAIAPCCFAGLLFAFPIGKEA